MHYDPILKDHGLPHDPFLALVTPRPIGWISSLSSESVVNLAPYSFFNVVSVQPPIVMFSSAGRKHSQSFAECGGDFVASLATYDLREVVNNSAATVPAEQGEPAQLGLEMAPSRVVKTPRVASSPVALECVYLETVPVRDRDGRETPSSMILGQVVSVYIDDAVIVDGRVELDLVRPLSRLGYLDYGTLGESFAMERKP